MAPAVVVQRHLRDHRLSVRARYVFRHQVEGDGCFSRPAAALGYVRTISYSYTLSVDLERIDGDWGWPGMHDIEAL